MIERFKYKVNSLQGNLIGDFSGCISNEDFISSWEYIFADNLITYGIKKFIWDFRDATLEMKIEELKLINDFFNKNRNTFRYFKIALISVAPSDVAILMLIESFNKGYNIKVFSTIDGATKWILNEV